MSSRSSRASRGDGLPERDLVGRFGEPAAAPASVAGVVFDLDGTLYPFNRAILLSAGVVLRHLRFFRAFARARRELRTAPPPAGAAGGSAASISSPTHRELDADAKARMRSDRLRDLQEAALAKLLRVDRDQAASEFERVVYTKWARAFERVKPYAGVYDMLSELRRRGARLAVLSDSPLVKEKLSSLGLAEFWDVTVAADEAGGFKPDPWPFTYVSHRLGVPLNQLLFVGNHYTYDVVGARRAGMLAAHFARRPVAFGAAHYTFANYRSFPEIEIASE